MRGKAHDELGTMWDEAWSGISGMLCAVLKHNIILSDLLEKAGNGVSCQGG